MEEILKEWLRVDKPFPREFFLNRVVVDSEEAYNKMKGESEQYFSIFSLNQILYQRFDTIVFDVEDATHSVVKSYNCYKRVIEKIGDIVSRIYFTGRGYHIYIDLANPIEDKHKYKEIANKIVEKYGIKD